MPIGLTLPSIDDFTPELSDQQSFFNGIEDTINELCANTPITIRSATTPKQRDFELAWTNIVGNSLPIPVEQEFIWYNTSDQTIGGYFRTINDKQSVANQVAVTVTISRPVAVNYLTNYQAVATNGPQLYIVDLMVNVLYRHFAPISTNVRATPTWDDAGTALAFDTTEYSANTQLAKINIDGTGLTRLTNNAFQDASPSWWNTTIAFHTNESVVGSQRNIWTIDQTGGSRTRITNNALRDTSPAFSSDGTKIAFLRSTDLGITNAIYIMDANGSNQTLLVAASADISPPTWSHDMNWIYYGQNRIHPDGTGAEVWWRYDESEIAIQPLSFISTDNWQENYFPTDTLGVPENSPGAVALASNDTAVISNSRIFSIQPDGYLSTSKVYQVSQYIEPAGGVRLLKQDLMDGTLNYSSISSAEMPNDIDHVLILIDSVATAAGSLLVRMNGDVNANNYATLYQRSNNATVTKVENLPGVNQGMLILHSGSAAPATLNNVIAIWVVGINDTDNLKQIVWEMGSTAGGIATLGNMNQANGFGVWNSTDAVTSMILALTAGNFTQNSRISYYGFPKSVRFIK